MVLPGVKGAVSYFPDPFRRKNAHDFNWVYSQ